MRTRQGQDGRAEGRRKLSARIAVGLQAVLVPRAAAAAAAKKPKGGLDVEHSHPDDQPDSTRSDTTDAAAAAASGLGPHFPEPD